MAFDFPATPSVGQVFGNYIWDGEKWKLQGGQALGAVRYDTPQILSAGQQAQARSNIAAPDLSALNYSGMQINGSMEVSQELGLTGRTTPGYVCDGWMLGVVGSTVAVASNIQGGGALPGIANRIYIQTTTAQASLSAGHYGYLLQVIEGYRISRLGWGTASAQPITIGFWSIHAMTGVFSVAIRNGAANRSYVATYTHNVASTAQYNTITIPGDTTGTWPLDNTAGMTVTFTMAAGTTFTAPAANTWAAGNYLAAPGQVNGFASTSNYLILTGVVVLPGIEAPTAAQSPLIMRPFDQELVTCQRYYEKSYYYPAPPGTVDNAGSLWYGGVTVNAGASHHWSMIFKQVKRIVPTVTTYSPSTGAPGKARDVVNSVDIATALPGLGDRGGTIATASLAVGSYQMNVHWVADARL